MNEWMIDWMNEWLIEWMNEWIEYEYNKIYNIGK